MTDTRIPREFEEWLRRTRPEGASSIIARLEELSGALLGPLLTIPRLGMWAAERFAWEIIEAEFLAREAADAAASSCRRETAQYVASRPVLLPALWAEFQYEPDPNRRESLAGVLALAERLLRSICPRDRDRASAPREDALTPEFMAWLSRLDDEHETALLDRMVRITRLLRRAGQKNDTIEVGVVASLALTDLEGVRQAAAHYAATCPGLLEKLEGGLKDFGPDERERLAGALVRARGMLKGLRYGASPPRGRLASDSCD